MAGDAHADLIQSAVRGASGALEEPLGAYHARLIRHIKGVMSADLRRFCASEDIAQETYIAVAREIRKFQPPFDAAAFRAWLFRVADHRRLSMLQLQRALKRGGGRAPLSPGELASASRDRGDNTIDLLELLAAHSRTPSRSTARGGRRCETGARAACGGAAPGADDAFSRRPDRRTDMYGHETQRRCSTHAVQSWAEALAQAAG